MGGVEVGVVGVIVITLEKILKATFLLGLPLWLFSWAALGQERYISPKAFVDTVYTTEGNVQITRLDAVYSRQIYFTIQNRGSADQPYRQDTVSLNRIRKIHTGSEATAKLLQAKGTIAYSYHKAPRKKLYFAELAVRVGPSLMLGKHGSSFFKADKWLESKLPVAAQADIRLRISGKGPWGAYVLYSNRSSSGSVGDVSGYYTYHLVGLGAQYRHALSTHGYWHAGAGMGISRYQSRLTGLILPSATSYTYTHGGQSGDYGITALAEAGAHIRVYRNLYAGVEGSLIVGREDARGEMTNGYGAIYVSPSSNDHTVESVSRIGLALSVSVWL